MQTQFIKVDDYTVIDLETAGLSSNREIIQLGAVKVRDNKIIDRFSAFVKPSNPIPYSATRINNITNEMVKDAPCIEAILPEFLNFIGNDAIVGHNIKSFDIPTLMEYSKIDNQIIDTYLLAKRCLPDMENHRLKTLINELELPCDGIHRADADCETTFYLYNKLKEFIDFPDRIIPSGKKDGCFFKVSTDNDKFSTNIFECKSVIIYGSLKSMSVDAACKILDVLGAEYAVDYFDPTASYLILGDTMYKKYISCADDELISEVLKYRIRVLSEMDFAYYANLIKTSIANSSASSFKIDVSGKTFCLTGEFTEERQKIENKIIQLGGIVKKNPVKSLNYLVIGSLGSPDWKFGTFGRKYELAEHLNEKGASIAIIKETDFIEEVKEHGTVNV